MKSGLLSLRSFIPIIWVLHFRTIGMSMSYQLYILASRFQILLLEVDDLFVLQELFSQLLPDQRT